MTSKSNVWYQARYQTNVMWSIFSQYKAWIVWKLHFIFLLQFDHNNFYVYIIRTLTFEVFIAVKLLEKLTYYTPRWVVYKGCKISQSAKGIEFKTFDKKIMIYWQMNIHLVCLHGSEFKRIKIYNIVILNNNFVFFLFALMQANRI